MEKIKCLVLTAVILLIAGTAGAESTQKAAKAKIRDGDGNALGYVIITEGDIVTLTYNIGGLEPGAHAFHIHASGKCEPPFKSVGGHFNPFGRKHGIKNPEGRHAGDMENIVAGPDGIASGVRFAPLVTLGSGSNSLFREGGTAIVIHEGPDDYTSDPAGDAGKRVACGVIKKKKKIH